MNVLSFDKQVRVVASLVEGCSIRGTERLCGVNRETIGSLGLSVGEACRNLHDNLMTDLQVNVLEVDEIWSFIGKKQKRVKPTDDAEFGDQYTFIGLDANKKAIVSFLTGRRDADSTDAFALDLRHRIVNRPQVSSDGFGPYVEAINLAFQYDVDFAQIVKVYGSPDGDDHKYSPPKCISAQRSTVCGNPDWDHISTSYVERQNLSMRMSQRRFTRLTNAFSKKLRNHRASVALYAAHYNFCRIHETLGRITPAMAIGVADHVWSVAELVETAMSMAPPSWEPPVAPVVSVPPPPPALPGGPRFALLQGGRSS